MKKLFVKRWLSPLQENVAPMEGWLAVYPAADTDARIAILENALNLIRDGCADDECAFHLNKEDMQQIASHALMDRT